MKVAARALCVLGRLAVLLTLALCQRQPRSQAAKSGDGEKVATARPDSLDELEEQVGDLIYLVRTTPTEYDDPRTNPAGVRMLFEALP